MTLSRKIKLTDVPEERLAKVAGILGIGTDQLVDRLVVRSGQVGLFVEGGWCWVWDPEDDDLP